MTREERIEKIKRNIRVAYECIGRALLADDDDGIAYNTMHLKAWQDELKKLGVKDVEAQELELTQPDYKGALRLVWQNLLRMCKGEIKEGTKSSVERAYALKLAIAYMNGVCEARGIDL